MAGAGGHTHLVFNGEILNYRELRAGLSYPSRTSGDTEVYRTVQEVSTGWGQAVVTLTQSTAKRGYMPSGIAAAVVIASSAVVAALGILVTAGGRDQQVFHLPSVMYLREKAPNIDIVNMPTATGPLYGLLIAAVPGPLHLGAVGTQIVGSFFAAALAALAVWHTRTVPHA